MLTRKSNMADTISPKNEYYVAGDLATISVSTFPYLGGQAPSHTLLSPCLVVTQEVQPSILPLEGGICAHFL